MEQTTPVPSVQFEPSKHVIAGRRLADGRQLFFSLASIVDAEKAIETPVAGLSPDDLAAIEARILAAVPPPQFPADIIATLAEMTAAMVAQAKRIEKLEADNAIWAKNFAGIMSLAGGKG